MPLREDGLAGDADNHHTGPLAKDTGCLRAATAPVRSVITAGADVDDALLSGPDLPRSTFLPRAPNARCHRSRSLLVVLSDNVGDRSEPWLSMSNTFPPWCW